MGAEAGAAVIVMLIARAMAIVTATIETVMESTVMIVAATITGITMITEGGDDIATIVRAGILGA